MKRFLQNSGSSKLTTNSFTENPQTQQSVQHNSCGWVKNRSQVSRQIHP